MNKSKTTVATADLLKWLERISPVAAITPSVPVEPVAPIEPEPVAAVEPERVGDRKQTPETSQERRAAAAETARGVKREILIHWDEIAKLNGPDADAAQVARYLKTHRDEAEKTPERKTIHNRLGELRTAKLIP